MKHSAQSATPVNKDAIQTLVIQHGQREAARIAGLNENTVRSWALRYGWSSQTKQVRERNQSATNPVLASIADTLAERKQRTKLALAKYSMEASEELSEHVDKLKVTKEARDIASVASATWPEEQTSNVSFSLNVLNLGTCGIEVRDTQDASQDHPSIIDAEKA